MKNIGNIPFPEPKKTQKEEAKKPFQIVDYPLGKFTNVSATDIESLEEVMKEKQKGRDARKKGTLNSENKE